MKKILISISLLNILLGQTVIQIVPEKGILPLNSSFTLDINISNVQNLFSVAADLYYDPDLLQVISLNEGTFLKDRNTSTSFLYELDEQNGKIVIGLSRVGRENGGVNTQTDTLLFSVIFKSIKTGQTSLKLRNVGLFEPDGLTEISCQIKDTTITIMQNTSIPSNKKIIHSFRVLNNFPNPFNNRTVIPIKFLNLSERIKISVYDIAGNLVKIIYNDFPLNNFQKFTWDGKNENGIDVSSAIYLLEVKTKKVRKIKKIVLTK